MKTYSLIVNTHGICTHFGRGVVSGVPHRVVLPDSTNIMFGLITVEQESVLNPSPVPYYLVPHFPRLEAGEVELNIPGLLADGDIRSGIRVEVANCVDRELVYYTDGMPRLTDFNPEYTFASDVVLNGRAACYLDVYGGTVTWVPPNEEQRAGYVSIEMTTDGPPELLVTTLAPWTGTSNRSHRLSLAREGGEPREITLVVNNVELWQERPAEELSGAFDFLLHYLTARGGIPQSIKCATPGMPPDPQPVAAERLAAALRDMADLLVPATGPGKRTLALAYDLTASCAPSHYP
jgi:hypothetical protein